MAYADKSVTYDEARATLEKIGLRALAQEKDRKKSFFLRTIETPASFPFHFLMCRQDDGLPPRWLAATLDDFAIRYADLIPTVGTKAFHDALTVLASRDGREQVLKQLGGDLSPSTKIVYHTISPKNSFADHAQEALIYLRPKWRGHRLDTIPVPMGEGLLSWFVIATPLRELAKHQGRSERLMVRLGELGLKVDDIAEVAHLSRQQAQAILSSAGFEGRVGRPRPPLNLNSAAKKLLVYAYEKTGSVRKVAEIAGLTRYRTQTLLQEQGALGAEESNA